MPTVQRQLVDGPSREQLFDALRLQTEGRRVDFDVAAPVQPSTPPSDPSEEELLQLAVANAPSFPSYVIGIRREDTSGNLWVVEGVLVEGSHFGDREVGLVAHLNTRNRRESGILEVSW